MYYHHINYVNNLTGKNIKNEFWRIVRKYTNNQQITRYHLKNDDNQIRFDAKSNLKILYNWFNKLTGSATNVIDKDKHRKRVNTINDIIQQKLNHRLEINVNCAGRDNDAPTREK